MTTVAHPMARRTDPLSSHAAVDALEASGHARKQRDEALALVVRWPGMTANQRHDHVYGDWISQKRAELDRLEAHERRLGGLGEAKGRMLAECRAYLDGLEAERNRIPA